jgi:hypothetical protein
VHYVLGSPANRELQLQNRTLSRRVAGLLGLLALVIAMPMGVLAAEPANEYFERTWERTDRQVADLDVTRTWIWGPSGFTVSCMEPNFKTASGEREVQYFDKSRMEITDPLGDRDSDWYVTQGLLATEMITGEMQLGDDEFLHWGPAEVHIAGDHDGGSPSYADFAPLMEIPPLEQGEPVTQTLSSDGTQGNDPSLADYGVTAQEYVPDTNHRVASVFWDFMNSEGPMIEGGVVTSGPLFSNPYYAVGFPITEAYWTNVAVDGVYQDVLVQAFQRRVLTYTPGNDEGWQVEAGNVGQHYYMWRYGEIPADSAEACPLTSHVTFNVYEQAGDGSWDSIAITTTREVWHPNDIATGTWAAYTDEGGEVMVRNSGGILVADHTYTTIAGRRILSGLDARVTQVEGPTSGTAHIIVGGFSPGGDPRVPNSVATGSGTLSYDTGTESDTISFEVVAGTTNTFHVFLDGPAPPVFFQ